LRQLSKHWFSFFPTVCDLWRNYTNVTAAASQISKFWTQDEIRLTATVLQCTASPHFLAKTILRAKSSDEFVPF
jgi:hypothetical protein